MPDWSDMLDPSELSGMVFVFTGQMTKVSRSEATQAVKDWGGCIVGVVTPATTHLAVGSEGASNRKIANATKHGTTILDEAAFMALVRIHRT